MATTLGEELTSGRKLTCRYLRRNGERCTNEVVADPDDDDVLLCGKHVYRAYMQFTKALARTVDGAS